MLRLRACCGRPSIVHGTHFFHDSVLHSKFQKPTSTQSILEQMSGAGMAPGLLAFNQLLALAAENKAKDGITIKKTPISNRKYDDSFEMDELDDMN